MIKYNELNGIYALISFHHFKYTPLDLTSPSLHNIPDKNPAASQSFSSAAKYNLVQFIPSVSYLIQTVPTHPASAQDSQEKEQNQFLSKSLLALSLFSTSFFTSSFLQIRIGRGRGTSVPCAYFHGGLLDSHETG